MEWYLLLTEVGIRIIVSEKQTEEADACKIVDPDWTHTHAVLFDLMFQVRYFHQINI